MPVDNTTDNRGYDLPHASNNLSDDVGRIITAMEKMDGDVATLFASVAGYITQNSPSFTGIPTAPTASASTNTNQLATTAFVQAVITAKIATELGNLIDGAPEALNTLNELAAAVNDEANFAADTISRLDALEAVGPNPVTRFVFTAVGSEVSITGNDDNAATLAFTAGRELVFLNGVMLVSGVDYTTSGGDTIASLSALSVGSQIVVVAL